MSSSFCVYNRTVMVCAMDGFRISETDNCVMKCIGACLVTKCFCMEPQTKIGNDVFKTSVV